MSSLIKDISFGNILTIITIIFAAGLSYGTFTNSAKEQNILRSIMERRIEIVETNTKLLETKINELNNRSAVLNADLDYIRKGIDELKLTFKEFSKK